MSGSSHASTHDSRRVDLLQLTTTTDGGRSIVAKLRLKRGLYQMNLVTRDGGFPTDTLLIPLKEWPSLQTVLTGPFDFDHTQYRMVVPTFRAWVNNQDAGLVWCEVPPPADMAARRVRAMWGIEVENSGPVEIRLDPEGESRLRWSELAELTMRPDDRRYKPLHIAGGLRRPRLYVSAPQFRKLQDHRDPIQERILSGLRLRLEHGDRGTYVHREAIAAVVGRLTGRQRWIDEAIGSALAMCARPYWGYHDIRDIMGWNNDRDTGMRMFEVAFVYDWLHDHLSDEQRATIQQKLACHAELAFKVTRLQKSYWYYRANEAHGHGLWFGFAAAAAALAGVDERAGKWLAWIHGNICDAVSHMPSDGVTAWPIYNSQWLIVTVCMLERLQGKKLSARDEFLKSFRGHQYELPHGGVTATILLMLARRHHSRTRQGEALAAMFGSHRAARTAARRPEALALLAYDPSLPAGRPPATPAAQAGLGGLAYARSQKPMGSLIVQCGMPVTRRFAACHNFIANALYTPDKAGSFQLSISGQVVVPVVALGYRKRTGDGNVITIDGTGHPAHGCYLGISIAAKDAPIIDRFITASGLTWIGGDLSRAYVPSAGVRRLRRDWLFFHDKSLLVLHDTVELHEPRELLWHLHAYHPWQADTSAGFVIDYEGIRFRARPMVTMIDGTAPTDARCLQSRDEASCYVPPYTFGLNKYKTLDWQPELQTRKVPVPTFHDLQVGPPNLASTWQLWTVMGLADRGDEDFTWRKQDQAVRISLGTRLNVTSAAEGPVMAQELDPLLLARYIVRLGIGRQQTVLALGVTGSSRKGREAAGLLWRPGRKTPTVLEDGAPGE